MEFCIKADGCDENKPGGYGYEKYSSIWWGRRQDQ